MTAIKESKEAAAWLATFFVLCMIVAWLFCGCGTWSDSVRKSLMTAKTVADRGMAVAQVICTPAFDKCLTDRIESAKCYPLQQCQRARDKMLQVTETLLRTIKTGLAALQASDKPGVDTALTAAFTAAAEVQATLNAWGVE